MNEIPEVEYLIRLRQILSKRFDEGELRTLCFDLGIDYDDLPGAGKANKAREMVRYVERRGRIPELVAIGKRLRPDVAWTDISESIGALTRPSSPPRRARDLCISGEQETVVESPRVASKSPRSTRVWFFVVPVLVAGMFVIIIRQFHRDLVCEMMRYIPGHRCFQVYSEEKSAFNHFFPSGFMGDIEAIRLEGTTEDVHSGMTALKITYESPDNGLGWAGVVWQYPSNNWGTLEDGFDLRGYRYVTFWAKSTHPDQPVCFGIGGAGWKPGTCERDPRFPYAESLCPAVEVTCNLTDSWLRFAIPVPENSDLHHVITGFAWIASNSLSFSGSPSVFQNSISEFAASHSRAVKPRFWAFKPHFREVYPKIRAWSSRYREVGKSRTRFRYCDGLPASILTILLGWKILPFRRGKGRLYVTLSEAILRIANVRAVDERELNCPTLT